MKLNEYIAAQIVRHRTQRRFSTLHADYLEQHMSNSSCTTTGLQVHDNNANRVALQNAADAAVAAKGQTPKVNPDLSVLGEASQPVVGPIKPVDFKTITGSYPGDHRTVGAQPDPLKGNDKAPRAETNDELEGVGG